MTRRGWLVTSAAMQAAAQRPPAREVVIASSNGVRACDKAVAVMRAGGDTLDAAIAGVNINEDDPEDSSVGYGGLPNEDGVVELDASVMHGPTRRAGSVAALRNVRYASRVAKLVMEQTDHIMLVGQGALEFARAWGFKEENLLTEKSRLAWMVWKQSLRDSGGQNTWTDGLDAPAGAPRAAALVHQFPDTSRETLEWARAVARHPVTGTINCLTLNRKGEMSGVTTTSGLSWKLAGRVGDSPIIGAGLFVDPDVGAAGSTGRGEENIRIAGAHTIVENMRHGMSPKDACLDALNRIVRNYHDDRTRLGKFDINFYALRKDGQYAGSSLWNVVQHRGAWVSRQFAVSDGGKARLEDCVYLLERR
ncbi:MAG TPA: N(4)-(beta-N-acetylglucosaminyl)-L-asparaginase [Bryobacteraceae bacterium]|nr:N(4)-(beta-N-acetylglucosaminyl)-L-asparaginase [Bryobacteraceae bacterium]